MSNPAEGTEIARRGPSLSNAVVLKAPECNSKAQCDSVNKSLETISSPPRKIKKYITIDGNISRF